MIKKFLLIVILISLAINLLACSANINKKENNIEIVGMSSSMGGVEGELDNFNKQEISYEISLKNNQNDDIYIKTITPVLNSEFLKLVENDKVTIEVNKSVKSNKTIQIKGKIIFNAEGMSKEDIIEMQPFFTKIRVVQEKEINIKQ